MLNTPYRLVLTLERVMGVELRHHAKFRGDRSNRCRDIATFGLFKMATAAILDFWNFKFLTLKKVELRHCAKLSRNRSYRGRDVAIFRFFQDGGRPLSWLCDAWVGTTHERHLVVFITVQNLVGIDVVVLIMCTFFDFASLAWKRLFTPQNWGSWGLTPKWGTIWKKQKAHPLASPLRWAIMRENPSTGLTCMWVPQKRV